VNRWWKNRIAYQIYPLSFQDSNNDGIGDIRGIISRLDELKALGIGILWLSPVYKSLGTDNGYDISDYCSVDPRFGTMEDIEALFAEAAGRDIKIIMDLVINHTSDEHEWFRKSRNSEGRYRDYYIWQKPGLGSSPDRPKPPNNWTGFFMENAWEYDAKSGEYYLHLFHKKQPDLNYKNPYVLEEVKKILRFWLDKGASGFRCDVINVLYKESLEDGRRSLTVQGIEHYKSREGNHAVLRELRRDVLDKYDCFTVGETVMVDVPEAKLLCDESRKELDMLFYFEHLEVDRRIARFIPKKFRADKLLAVLAKWQRGLEWNAVYLENHDQPRIVSHFGAGGPEAGGGTEAAGTMFRSAGTEEYWKRSAKLLALMEMSLRGTVFIYQGQEIGMTNFDFKSMAQVKDVESLNLDRLMKKLHIPGWLRWKWIRASSRDNARTPMQWSGGKNAGFTGGCPWLGINANYKRINHEAQKQDPASILNFYKMLIRLRLQSPCLMEGAFRPLYGDSRIMIYSRELGNEIYTVALNFSGRERRLGPAPAALIKAAGLTVVSNTGRTEAGKELLPWEGMLCKRKLKKNEGEV
jgi:oligo-1,6-glucosidase